MDKKEKNKKETGQRIKNIRLEKGLTMKEFGARLTPPAADSIVSRWERGVSLPNNKRLEQIAGIGEMSVKYLTTGEKSFSDLEDNLNIPDFPHSIDLLSENDIERETLISDLHYYASAESNLSQIEVNYLTQTLKFLDYAKAEDVKTMAALFRHLNIHKDIAESNVSSAELLAHIELDVEFFKRFLMRRYGFDEGD